MQTAKNVGAVLKILCSTHTNSQCSANKYGNKENAQLICNTRARWALFAKTLTKPEKLCPNAYFCAQILTKRRFFNF